MSRSWRVALGVLVAFFGGSCELAVDTKGLVGQAGAVTVDGTAFVSAPSSLRASLAEPWGWGSGATWFPDDEANP